MAEAKCNDDSMGANDSDELNSVGSILQMGNGKRDLPQQNDSVEPVISDSGDATQSKKAKRESPSNSTSGQTSKITGGQIRKRNNSQRCYRNRLVESSSDESLTDGREAEGELKCQNEDDINENSPMEVESNASNNKRDESDSEDHPDDIASSANATETHSDLNTSNEAEAPSLANRDASPNAASVGEDGSRDRISRRYLFSRLLLDSSSEDSDEGDFGSQESESRVASEQQAKRRAEAEESIAKDLQQVMEKEKPKYLWSGVAEIWKRQYGAPSKQQSSVMFAQRYYDSLHVPSTFNLLSKLSFHDGCVNSLGFNSTGDLLASGSDDLRIAIWDWCKEKTYCTYNSGHRSNVFQCKFLSDDRNIVSCARDGQIRLAELSPSGVCRHTRKLAKHSRAAHKLAKVENNPFEVMSSGHDGVVFNIDIRTPKPDRLIDVKDFEGRKVPLNSISTHPMNDTQFCVAGQDEYVRVYDKRIVGPLGLPVLKYAPSHLIGKKEQSYITCAVYSNNGDAVIASYNDEDIYLYDTNLSDGAEPVHSYSGHRNSNTVKGVSFFSPSSQYIVSGSDCGNIFFWDRDTEAIVNCFPGDENGVVNVLEPHPTFPILATSGLDDDVKVWYPAHVKSTMVENLEQTVKSNLRRRVGDRNSNNFGIDATTLLAFFQDLSRRNPSSRNLRSELFMRGALPNPSGLGQSSEDDDAAMLDASDTSSGDNDSDESDDESGLPCTTS